MATGRKFRGFYFITDAMLSVNGIVEDVEQALEAGSVIVQYREKRKVDRMILVEEATAIKNLCKSAGVVFLINDDVYLAKEVNADGVHIGQDDMPIEDARRILGDNAVIGVSVRNVEQAKEADAKGASYLAVSAVFPTTTKPDAGPSVGVEGVKKIRAVTDLPLAAIGGLNFDNIPQVISAGADMICAISTSLAGGKVKENIQKIIAMFPSF